MTSSTTQRDPNQTKTRKAKSNSSRFPGGKVLADHIATAAYYKAQARGFEAGREIEDWLDAEAEVLRQSAG